MTSLIDTEDPVQSQPHYLQHQACNQFDLFNWLDICPHSQTMSAFDLDRNESLLYALPCNEWSCRHCARRKTSLLAHRTASAKPNRLCTLTVDPKLHANPRAAFDATRRQVPEWIRVMRSKFGEVEYLRVTELHKSGYPHYHLLIRSRYIPHPCARDEWFLLTGASIVDIRAVKKKFNCYTYLLKYLTKLHHIEWTGRHVSYSRGFFPPNEDSRFAPHRLELKKIHNCHPSTLIMEYHSREFVEKLTPRTYRFRASPQDLDRDREVCGETHHVDYFAPPLTPNSQAAQVAKQRIMSWFPEDPGSTKHLST